MAKTPDPLRRNVPADQIPLESPMPRSPILDREEPELRDEKDIPDADDNARDRRASP